MSLSIQGMTAFMRDLGREIARALPARNLVIVNGHGGNRGILEALAQEMRSDFGLNICILHPAALADTNADGAAPEIHGGKNETSMMLAIAPHLVRRDQIATLKNPPEGDAVRKTILQRGVTWPWSTDDKRIADTGVIGDAKAASAEFGRAYPLPTSLPKTAGGVLKQLLNAGLSDAIFRRHRGHATASGQCIWHVTGDRALRRVKFAQPCDRCRHLLGNSLRCRWAAISVADLRRRRDVFLFGRRAGRLGVSLAQYFRPRGGISADPAARRSRCRVDGRSGRRRHRLWFFVLRCAAAWG